MLSTRFNVESCAGECLVWWLSVGCPSCASPQGARVWIPDCVHVWRAAEITRGYEEGDSVLHLRLEDGSVRLGPCGS